MVLFRALAFLQARPARPKGSRAGFLTQHLLQQWQKDKARIKK